MYLVSAYVYLFHQTRCITVTVIGFYDYVTQEIDYITKP